MKIRDLTLLLATCLGAIAAASMIITVVVLLDNRELRQEMRELRAGWNGVAGENRQLREERSEAESAFASQGAQLRRLEAELDAIRSGMSSNAPATAQGARAYRAPVFIGQQYLGEGWVAPNPKAADPTTGQRRYEPVVVLDPALRTGLAAGNTNVVERQVAAPTTVNYNYPYPYAYWWWPTYWVGGTNWNGCDRPEDSPQAPPQAPPASPAARVTTATVSFTRPAWPGGTPVFRAPGVGYGRPALTPLPVGSQGVSGARPLSPQPRLNAPSSPLN